MSQRREGSQQSVCFQVCYHWGWLDLDLAGTIFLAVKDTCLREAHAGGKGAGYAHNNPSVVG